MIQITKNIIKNCLSYINPSIYNKLLSLSLLKYEYKELSDTKSFNIRERLWDVALNVYTDEKPITFIEFGVYQGYSIKYFSQNNKNKNSIFFGLDTFTGLPENWMGTQKKLGHFDTQGQIPKVNDQRVIFIKGLFQDTFSDLSKKLSGHKNLIVHFDADLYSSTLYVLTKLDDLKKPYVAIFDEFFDHESRALSNYISAFNPKIKFLGKTIRNNYPDQILCLIEPK